MTSVSFDEVSVGHELPALVVPLTRSLIVATAIATRDYQEVHHDPDLARERGSQDIIMNILTTNGFVGRFVTDWAGPDASLRRVAIKLGAPNLPGDTMKLVGSVTRKDETAGEVEVEVTGKNAWGNHVTGTVRLMLPRRASAGGAR
jgi:acyl dehydratase